MSDFRFSCPTCGQNIVCDTSNAGMQVGCPGCQGTITVPEPPPPAAPAVPAGGARLSINKTAHHPPPPAPGAANAPDKPAWGTKAAPPAPKKFSVLAIVSFVCSLLGTLGCLPAIICGHIARAKIAKSSSLKGKGFTTAALILGYLSLFATIGWFFVAVPYLKKQADILQQQQEEAARQAEAARVAAEAERARHATWKLDLANAKFPDRPASGKLHTVDFTADLVTYQNGNLTLADTAASREFVVSLRLKSGQSPAGQSFDISTTDADKPPRVSLLWRDEGATKASSQIFTNGYALKLEFGDVADGKLPGKIYLCVPDPEQSFVAGNFEIGPRRPGAAPGAAPGGAQPPGAGRRQRGGGPGGPGQ